MGFFVAKILVAGIGDAGGWDRGIMIERGGGVGKRGAAPETQGVC